MIPHHQHHDSDLETDENMNLISRQRIPRRSLFGITMGGLAFLVVGCGGDDEAQPAGETDNGEAEDPPPAPGGEQGPGEGVEEPPTPVDDPESPGLPTLDEAEDEADEEDEENGV